MPLPEKRPDAPGPLAGLRVLDLTDEAGMYCGKLLADLGAEVVLVEPPRGTAARRSGPFLDGIVSPDRSLTFWYLNTSKLGITLDLDHPDGARLLLRLAAGADVLIEASAPGSLQARGVGHEALQDENPRLIVASITPFGQDGPWAGSAGGDLVVQALGGLTSLTGYADGPPTRVGGTQGFMIASAHAAVGIMLAIHQRAATGRGQHVDVSAQEAAAFSTQPAIHWLMARGEAIHRNGNDYDRYGTIVACRDGYLAVSFNRTDVQARTLDWLEEEGLVADLRDDRWRQPAMQRELRRALRRQVEILCATRGKQEMAAEAQRRRIWFTPVNRTLDLRDDAHLRARDYFAPVEHPEAGRVVEYPGRPYCLSETPWRVYRRAPVLGEHNSLVYGEIGLNAEDMAALAAAGVI